MRRDQTNVSVATHFFNKQLRTILKFGEGVNDSLKTDLRFFLKYLRLSEVNVGAAKHEFAMSVHTRRQIIAIRRSNKPQYVSVKHDHRWPASNKECYHIITSADDWVSIVYRYPIPP